MNAKGFDVTAAKEFIRTAAWESGSKDVSIYTGCLTGELPEPVFFLSKIEIYTDKWTEDTFLKYLTKFVGSTTICHAVVADDDILRDENNTRLIDWNVWVYN